MGVYLRRLEQRYMEEQKEMKEINQTQKLPWLVKKTYFSTMKEKHI